MLDRLRSDQSYPRFLGYSLMALFPVLVSGIGCEEERAVSSKPKVQAQTKPPAAGKLEFIVGKRTQKVKNAAPELQKGGAIEATTKITAKDPITLQGNAYVTIIGRTALLNMQHAMDLYHAEHDRYPKNYDEFMSEIIKAGQISLPQLPYYQAYGYDEKEHKLVILEYPDLKNQPLPQ
jgi:hypothetical protein